VFRALAKQFPNAAEITPNQAQAWIDGLITKNSPAETIRGRKGRSAFTVRNTWLRATKALYAWAVKRRMVPSNPFAEVIVEKHKRPQRRPKHLYDHEITTILRAASAVDDHTDKPDVVARRWVSWLLAYTGARPSEVTQLRSQDVKQIDGVWCVDFNPDAGAIKTDEARVVPLHPHLIEQGFLEFAQRHTGPMFYRPRRGKQDTVDVLNQKKSPAAQARQRLSEWIRGLGVNGPKMPLHAWRHTFKLRGDRAGIPEKTLDHICGHAPATVGRGYGRAELRDLAAAIKRFPRYELGG
jgi:integrase